MTVLRNIGTLATCRPEGPQDELHVLERAAVAWDDGRIAWVGSDRELPLKYRHGETLDAKGRLVVPGLVDCHTHLCFGGWRADEFVLRIQGASYLDISRGGGGILRTVTQTRNAGFGSLLEDAERRLEAMMRLGVTTVEGKSGYGLDEETEIRQLEVYAALGRLPGRRLVSTFLAHIPAPDYGAHRSEYVDFLCRDLLPLVAARRLARFCDVFVEESAFSLDEARTILRRARELGLALKLHADQLSDGRGAELAAEMHAVSADHLECISDAGILALARAGVIAVSLPLASLYLDRPPMPARKLLSQGVPVAVATDFNPGSAPSYHLPLAMTMACLLQKMTPAEVLKGATCVAARAIGLEAEVGSIEVGKSADLVVVEAPDTDHWLYHLRANAAVLTVTRGHVFGI